jgi:hypothetical protein
MWWQRGQLWVWQHHLPLEEGGICVALMGAVETLRCPQKRTDHFDWYLVTQRPAEISRLTHFNLEPTSPWCAPSQCKLLPALEHLQAETVGPLLSALLPSCLYSQVHSFHITWVCHL